MASTDSGSASNGTIGATRQQMWERLGSAPVDLLVIGGGINGAGIARDATRRGLSVAVVDMNDLAFGTSSRSSKLIHGGLRYLEQYEVGLVFESVSERRILMDLAPHLVSPLGFLFPVYKDSRRNLFVIQAGMWLYDGLSLFRSPKRHRMLSPRDLETEEPALRREDLKGAPLYYDCSTDDARLTLETAIDAVRGGATITTWAKVTQLLVENGRVCGATVRDELTGATKDVRASAVINATGPWTDRTLALPRKGSEAPAPPRMLRTTKGVHIVVDRAKLPLNNAVVCFHPVDKRVLFAIPWGDRSYVGTTDTDDPSDPSGVHATREDVDYLIAASNAYFPEHPLTRTDVIATWAGLRPLIDEGAGANESQVSREHKIVIGQEGLITIAGGKLTTYRRMSIEVVDTAVRYLQLANGLAGRDIEPSRTEKAPLPGAEGWPDDDDATQVVAQVEQAGNGTISNAVATALTDQYGTRAIAIAALCAARPALASPLVPGRPEILAQIEHAVREEMAATVCDALVRRTQLFFRDFDQGLGCAERVASHMGTLLGWDDATRQRELQRYRDEVELSRHWRKG
ncbi:glycerol-3-phosphate dehydrogenase [Sandaracinus amylolyticus]|uniref:glycerol-3-phosphate dehydrogenase n=1 Tax=Sandaracinus amylolyticus TaxID=927083 RepID=UPI001F022533|nr:glycerol-3-phosphate dehydrogenase [Sandaracinus amylolyticus]UJR80284.1 Aerobic glycerol-3-phosphate dehydrogenase [Sandaracinus amylolyticus]